MIIHKIMYSGVGNHPPVRQSTSKLMSTGPVIVIQKSANEPSEALWDLSLWVEMQQLIVSIKY